MHPRLLWAVSGLALLAAVWLRLHNATTYPADWGYDARFNWQYIVALTRDWTLPRPDAGWSTGDPPLYFYLSASLLRLGARPVSVPLLNVALGLVLAALAAVLVRRHAPRDPLRAALAAGLLLYLPAHAHMSAMVNEELLAATFTSLAVFTVARPAALPRTDLRTAALAGLFAGLAILTKLTGVLALAAVAATYAFDGLQRSAWRDASRRLAVAIAVALLAGGWFWLRNRWLYGWFQPFGLPAHELMFTMPPGARSLVDYVWLPMATFTNPNLLDPDLLHSVWGSTYASVWFDAQRFFLPTASTGVTRLGTLTLLLALLPTAACFVGLGRGLGRVLRGGGRSDVPLLALTALTLVGYAWYTWRNPWFAVIKGTTLLGLALPYAWYASEVLLDWARRSRATAAVITGILAALAVCVTISCTFNGAFERTEVSGLAWEKPGRR